MSHSVFNARTTCRSASSCPLCRIFVGVSRMGPAQIRPTFRVGLVRWVLPCHVNRASLLNPGRRIHVQHHERTYHHVCIDGPELVFSVMLLSALVFKTIFGSHPSGDTAIFVYWFMGLMYIWCHYLVHTRYIPRTHFMKTIRQNHMRHHCRCASDYTSTSHTCDVVCRDSRYWFSFTCPLLDEILDSVPPRSTK